MSVQEIIHQCIFPLMEKLMHKLSEFDELFAEKRLLFGNHNSSRLIVKIEQAKELVANDKDRYMNDVTFRYELNGFKKAGTNAFSCAVNLQWRFEPFKYFLFIEHNNYEKAIVRLYHQLYTEEEMNTYVNECGRLMLNKMEEQLKEQ